MFYAVRIDKDGGLLVIGYLAHLLIEEMFQFLRRKSLSMIFARSSVDGLHQSLGESSVASRLILLRLGVART